MMQIYEVNVSFWVEHEDEENEKHTDQIDATFHLGCECLEDALLNAMEHLDENLGENEYRLTSVKELDGVSVINWPGEDEPCDCPICSADTCAAEDLLQFTCINCGEPVRLADGTWDSVPCPHCGKLIGRDKIISVEIGRAHV
jgi:predicted RNA-binding Zn-ribbon protein involved in translation (DUF1610 family)